MNPKLLLVGAFLGASVVSQAFLVVNGDFESDSYPASGHVTLTPSSTLTGWTILSRGNVAGIGLGYAGGGMQAAPSQEIDLSGVFDKPGTLNGPGISQKIATFAGGVYAVSFDVYTFSTNNSLRGGVDFYWNGGLVQANIQDVGNTRTRYTFSNLVATGSATEIMFVSTNGKVSHIDNVEAVPEPATMALLGLAAAAVARRRARKA